MRYSTEPKFKKYVKEYGFLSFASKSGDKYGKKLMDTATKTGIDAAKTASKRVIIKQLIKLLQSVKQKKKDNTNKPEEIYIP